MADGVIEEISADRPEGTIHELPGFVIPGLPNLHSHAFQRALAGHGEARTPGRESDSFWSWRETMYAMALAAEPEDVEAAASMAYVEMLESGMTAVGEFHYLHHDATGQAYDDPAETSLRILAAAERTGLRCTLLPVLYRYSGVDKSGRWQEPSPKQRRFVHDRDDFVRLVERLRGPCDAQGRAILGWAPHSLRAVSQADLAWVSERLGSLPTHIHIAEQMAEVAQIEAALGVRPVQWLLDNLDVGPRHCLVHATHVDDAEVERLARSGAVAGLCPTTEASLGDGIFPGTRYIAENGAFGVGSDSHVRISATEELRLLEWTQRLRDQERNLLVGSDGSCGAFLWEQACLGGQRALGLPQSGLCEGAPADFVELDAETPRLAGHDAGTVLDAWIFASGSDAVRTVAVAGEPLVVDGRHRNRDAVTREYRDRTREWRLRCE